MSKGVYWVVGAVVAALVIVAAYALSGGFQPKLALEGTEWVLVSYGPQGAQQAALGTAEVTAIFDNAEGRVAGSGSVNRYFGGYTVDGNKLTVAQNLGSTKMMGPADAMDQEMAYFNLLAAAESFAISGDQLEIAASDGGLLVFQAR